MHAIDVGFGGDAETTQVFRIGEASCAVPGAAAGLEAVHRAYGRLPWAEVIAPAVELARSGIELSREQAHLHAILDLILRHTAEGKRLYSRPDGSRLQPGDTLRLPDLADTLELVAAGGAAVLYSGELSGQIVETVAGSGGKLTAADLASYEVIWRRAGEGALPRARGRLEPAAVVGRNPDRVRARAARAAGRAGGGLGGGVAALVAVMREQARARDDAFAAGLHDGGLEERLLDPAALAETAGAHRRRRLAKRTSPPRQAGRRTSPRSTPTAMRRRSRRRPARARA